MKEYILIAILFMIVVLSGCQREQNVITVLGENSSNLQAMQNLKKPYEEQNNVIIDFKPNSFEDAFMKANQDFTNKTGLYDIILQYNFSLSIYVRNNFVSDFDVLLKDIPEEEKLFEKDLFKNVWEEVGYYYENPKEYKGLKKVGYPFAANTMILVYNKDMFNDQDVQKEYNVKFGKNLEVPNNWEDYRNIAEIFTREDSNKKTSGVCMQGANNGWLYYEYCNYLYGMGGSVMKKNKGWEGNKDIPISINSESAINATNYYLSLKPFNSGSFLTVDANEQVKIIKEGNVAMAIVWSDYLYNLIYDENGQLDARFGFAPIPGEKSPIAGGSFYINNESKQKKESMKYIISLLQVENQIVLAKNGLCSPLKSTYEDPEIKKIPYSNALKTSLERGVYMFEAGPESNLINEVITKYIQKCWIGKLKVEEALSEISREIEAGRGYIYKD